MKLSLFILMALIVSCNKTEFKENNVPVSVPNASAESVQAPVAGNIDPNIVADGKLPAGHPPIDNQAAPKEAAAPVAKLEKAAGGYTIEEVLKGKSSLNGKKVSIRGKIVKYNSGIMKRNWIHIKDGSGADGSADLAVTTTENAKLNDTIIVSGTVQYDKNVGAGYFFPAIIEDANLKIEK